VPFFAVSGLRVQGDALRSGGQRKLALPDPGPDPTDADALLAALRARRRELSGERRLLVAVVMTALEDLRRYPSGTRPHLAARAWFMSDDDEWPLAFLPACAALELDPAAVRKRVHEALVARGAA
jgi:hypothetical protein